jgi:hypothetical protein
MLDRLVDLRIETALRLAAADEHAAALAELKQLHELAVRQDQIRQLDALLLRVRHESDAAELLRAANAQPPLISAVRELSKCDDPELVPFYVRHLAAAGPQGRQAILTALRKIDTPLALSAVARFFVHTDDEAAARLAGEILERGHVHRLAGREGDWAAIYPELEIAAAQPARSIRAREALRCLRGDG